MRKLLLSATSLSAIALSTVTFAQNAPNDVFTTNSFRDKPARITDYEEGFYIGGALGYSKVSSDWTFPELQNLPYDNVSSIPFDASSITETVYAGYDVSLPHTPKITAGFEVGVSFLSGEDSQSFLSNQLLESKIDAKRIYYGGPKLGYQLNGRVSLFGQAGYAMANVDGSVTVVESGTQTVNFQNTLTGWYGGIGAEVKVGEKGAIRAEIKHFDVSDTSVSTNVISGRSGTLDQKVTIDQFNIGYTFRF